MSNFWEAKRAEPQADTSALEGEIDQLVYQLYGLSEDEIGIVEGQEMSPLCPSDRLPLCPIGHLPQGGESTLWEFSVRCEVVNLQ